MTIFLLWTIAILGLGFALAARFRWLASPARQLPVTAEWIEELSGDRYRPMLRLLDQREIALLRAQPGFTPRMASRFRAERCQIFRRYLTHLESDFKRTCGALDLLLLRAGKDRPDLASTLVRVQLMFAVGLVSAHFRLIFYRFGLVTVNVAGLVKLFDGVRVELRSMLPAPAVSCA